MARRLDELRELHLPPPPGDGAALGLAVGLATALLLVALVAVWLFRRRRRAQRAALRAADAALAAYRQSGDAASFLQSLRRVLRQHAVRRHPAAAGLAGDDWLVFLENTAGKAVDSPRTGAGSRRERPGVSLAGTGGGFVAGPGRQLGDESYRARVALAAPAEAVVAVVKRWLRSNP